MNREQISDLVGSIADRHITATAQYDPRGVSGSPERISTMNIRSIRKPLLVAAVVALLLALGVTAYAAGWLAPIFHKMQGMTPDTERKALYEAAEQTVNNREQAPETVTLPAFDNSRITLSERYYDGKTLLLGVNLEEVVPGMTVGYTPDEAQLAKIDNVAFFHDVHGSDDLDALLSEGMERSHYEEYLGHRTDYAKEYDFRNLSAITLDWMLKEKLSAEEYEAAWRRLRETGHLCVVDSEVFIGDHIVLDDGTDLGVTGQQNMDSDDVSAHSGNIFIEVSSLPEAAQDRAALNINLNIKNARTWYYMELGGPAYFYYETVDEIQVPFTVENSGK